MDMEGRLCDYLPCKIPHLMCLALEEIVSIVVLPDFRSLTSNGVIKSLLGKMAGLVWRVENLVVEDRKVECKAKADGVSGRKLGGRDLSRCFVCLQRLVGRCFALISQSELGKVTVVVALPVRKD